MLFRSDRKSTRLNSSHTIISYAVFCLKKKHVTEREIEPRARWAGAEYWQRIGRRRTVSHPERGLFFFFFKDPAPPEIYPLPLPDPLPILRVWPDLSLPASIALGTAETFAGVLLTV